MVKIMPDLKLAYKDVLIKPQSSSLRSRKDVHLSRRFKFLHSGRDWKGIPIITANLFATGTYIRTNKLSGFKNRAVFIKTTIQTNDVFSSELNL